MLTNKDKENLKNLGLNQDLLQEQIELLNKESSFLNIYEPASIEKGIKVIENPEIYQEKFHSNTGKYSFAKFIPASGAATRMFKRYISYNLEPNLKNLNEGGFYSVKNGLEQIKNFAFYGKLKKLCTNIENIEDLIEKILYSGLNYANLPKGLLDFHSYADGAHTAFEEHLIETKALINNEDNFHIHLTVSPEFIDDFKNKLIEINKKSNFKFKLSFSVQEKSTDTISCYKNGDLVRNENKELVFRPGGHGALLTNLNKLEEDIIFIKNIDNLTHGDYLEETIIWKKVLAGILIETIEKIKEINDKLNSNYSDEYLNQAINFLEKNTNAIFNKSKNLKDEVLNYINRPIRVCGMVKNTGEPGGGPFWVKNQQGKISLQILEKNQINFEDQEQAKHFSNSSHFNPVDLVCYVKDPQANKFDLTKFVDKSTSFVSEKSFQGKSIKVLEHPGLWNGAMADWISIFVEVPLITFNPVKELNDLLRKEHQAK